MNLLYIAYSCDPHNGSEDKIGWNVPIESAKSNNVYVVTKEEHRYSIEKYLSNYKIENIEFYFVDIPALYKKIYKGFLYSGRLNIWNNKALPVVEDICNKNKIDIIHQITPIEFRAIGKYGRIPGIKFVCGPIGGGEYIPEGLRGYANKHIIIELIRYIINCWYRFLFKLTGRMKQCDYIMFANAETRKFLMGKNYDLKHSELFFDNGLGKDELSNQIRK